MRGSNAPSLRHSFGRVLLCFEGVVAGTAAERHPSTFLLPSKQRKYDAKLGFCNHIIQGLCTHIIQNILEAKGLE
jgi:hypothetical protein